VPNNAGSLFTMIELGLARISRLLLQQTPQSWKAIHVAGTNGKGSICAYLSAMLSANGITVGRFTSPHLIDRWDCITVNEQVVSETEFMQVEKLVKRRNRQLHAGATEFEILTTTAFEIFQRHEVEYGVVEVGLGGSLDATNVMKQKSVTVIAKIGLDHQSFLGDTLEKIAGQKAGIMRQGVPCVVDSSNHPSVLQVIEKHAEDVGAEIHYPSTTAVEHALSQAGLELEPHQIQNLACAHLAFRLACPDRGSLLSELGQTIKNVQWPGRLQMLDLSGLIGRQQPVLLDGAHNTQSAEVLSAFVDKHFRANGEKVTWMLAASQGKDIDEILKALLRPGDQVVAVKFGWVDGMPWVNPASPESILSSSSRHGIDKSQQWESSGSLQDALNVASSVAGSGPLVIAGSLYLVSDIMRLIRDTPPT
jgi:folylpolyglutamate synthase